MATANWLRRAVSAACFVAGAVTLVVACGKNAATNYDTSGDTSEAATSAAGGAVSGTAADTVSRVATEAAGRFASCPTMASNTPGTDCINGTNKASLIYPQAGCVYGAAIVSTQPIWTGQGATTVGSAQAYGGTELTVTGATAGSFTCSTATPFVLDATNRTSITRTFIGSTNADGTANTATFRVNHKGTESIVADTTNLKGYSYTPTNGGYKRTFANATTHNVSVGIHQIAYSGNLASSASTAKVRWNHTLSTQDSSGTDHPLTVTVASGTVPGDTTTAVLHTITSGTLYLQHNLAKFTAAASFTNLVHVPSKRCCFPFAGKITVTFSDGVNAGKTETLDFGSTGTACTLATFGQVQFTDVSGATSTKTLTHCL